MQVIRQIIAVLAAVWWVGWEGLGAPLCAAEPPAASTPHDFGRWEKEIAAFEAEDREHPPVPGGILFVGSSTIRLWKTAELFPDLKIVNRGFGGSEMIDSAHFAQRIVIPHRPRVVLVYAGSNDLSKQVTPCQILSDFRALVAAIRAELPETEIVFLSIKPSVKRWPLIHRIRATNALVEAVCVDEEHLHFLNVHNAMLNAEGLPETRYLAADGLHLNDAGYRHLTELVRPKLEELLARPAATSAAASPKGTPSGAGAAPAAASRGGDASRDGASGNGAARPAGSPSDQPF